MCPFNQETRVSSNQRSLASSNIKKETRKEARGKEHK